MYDSAQTVHIEATMSLVFSFTHQVLNVGMCLQCLTIVDIVSLCGSYWINKCLRLLSLVLNLLVL